MKLKELQIGDHFYPASKKDKPTHIFSLMALASTHGAQLAMCRDLSTNEIKHKPRNMEVIKKLLKDTDK